LTAHVALSGVKALEFPELGEQIQALERLKNAVPSEMTAFLFLNLLSRTDVTSKMQHPGNGKIPRTNLKLSSFRFFSSASTFV
jgi:hypothetical protein